MVMRIEIRHNVRDICGSRHWVTAGMIPLAQEALVGERIKALRELVADPNDICAVRITEEVIA